MNWLPMLRKTKLVTFPQSQIFHQMNYKVSVLVVGHVSTRVVYFFNHVSRDPTASSIIIFLSKPDNQAPLSNTNTEANSNRQLCDFEWAVVI